MAECSYRIKAKWPGKIPKETLKLIEKLFSENWKVEEYWQNNRNVAPKDFWPEFKKKFPATYQYVTHELEGDDDPEELSGIIDFGGRGISDEDQLINVGSNEIFYEAERVWHFADWSALAEWLRSLGATKVIWDSEEERAEPFEYYNYNIIIEDILNHKETLPTLMGINKELDELISEKLKS